jgi:hypothetical protein
VLTLTLVLTLLLTEYAGFSPAYIYERARLRALSSKYEFKDFDFKEFDFNYLTFPKFHGTIISIDKGGKKMNRQTQNQAQNAKNAQNGSTIVGVLAALVFIGIVTAMMVKNTGAQAANSAGYAMSLSMHSTAESGAMATEGFFAKNPTTGLAFINDVLKNGGEKYVFSGTGANQRIPLSNSSSGQFFSSKALNNKVVTPATDGGINLKTTFEVAAGNKQKGKALRKAQMFCQFGNLKQPQQTFELPNAKNVFYSGSGLEDGNASMNAKGGGVTFLKRVKFQNFSGEFDRSVYFEDTLEVPGQVKVAFKDTAFFMGYTNFQGGKDAEAEFQKMAYFGGKAKFNKKAVFNDEAYFMEQDTFMSPATFEKLAYFDKQPCFEQDGALTSNGNAYFKSSSIFKGKVVFKNHDFPDATGKQPWAVFKGPATFTGGGEFYRETYFEKPVVFGSVNPVFYHRVGFDDNITLGERLIQSKTSTVNNSGEFDIFFKGNFTDANINTGVGIQGTGASGHELYYKNLSPAQLAACTGLEKKQNASMTTVLSYSAFYTGTKTIAQGAGPTVPNKIPTANDRKDEEMNLAALYKDTVKTVNGSTTGNVKIIPAVKAMTECGSIVSADNPYCTGSTNFSITSLNNAYQKGKDEGYLYNGYLVVRVSPKDPTINWTDEKPGTFDDKIIIIVSDGATFNTSSKFYHSGENSSTLLYVGSGSATLDQFGTTGGLFRGFIYIDKANTAKSITISFGPGAKIKGAIHNFSENNKLKWNCGGGTSAMEIEFDPNAIAGLGSLYPQTGTGGGGTTDDTTVELQDPGAGISVKPLGYYFY